MLLVVSGVVAGCYKPLIGDMLKCADAGVHSCPEGFQCSAGYCRRPDSGVVDRPDTRPDVVEAGPEVMPTCFDARPNCQPDNVGICDPFCMTGCGPCEKCSVNTVGALTCNELAVGLRRGLLDNCDQSNTGMATQSDACLPGLVCLAAGDDACGSGPAGRCYQFCRVEADCTNAPCDKTITGGRTVCDVPFVDCNPVTPVSGCTGTQSCYLSTSHPTRTICDCPGGVRPGDICNRSRDCFAGSVCADPTNTGDFRCRQVCSLSEMGLRCPGGVAPDRCVPFKGNSTTTANQTYGFCRD